MPEDLKALTSSLLWQCWFLCLDPVQNLCGVTSAAEASGTMNVGAEDKTNSALDVFLCHLHKHNKCLCSSGLVVPRCLQT